MNYKVTRKEVSTGKLFTTICTQEQVYNITKYPISLYQLESIETITEEHQQEEQEELTVVKKDNLTFEQKQLKQLLKDFNLKYENIGTKIYINKNRKIKNIEDVLFYFLNYKILKTGEYIKTGDYISVYNNGIMSIEICYNKRIKVDLYAV